MYEWDMPVSVMRDFKPCAAYLIPSELKRLQGFFLAAQGSLVPFPFEDPDDNTVVGQSIGTTDGSSSTEFTLIRTYGDISYGGAETEPIGLLNTLSTLYINGVPGVLGTDYSVTTTTPYGQYVNILNGDSGHPITVDMTYYFWVRFKDDSLDFEKFSGAPGAGYWAVKKLTLHSLKN